MSIDRSALEKAAMESVSADFYYEMCDTIEEASDTELQDIVDGRVPASTHFQEGVGNV